MTTQVTLVYPFDILGNKIGGIETFLRGFVKYAPATFELRHVGITSGDSRRPIRTWHHVDVGGRQIDSFAVFHERDENRKTVAPLGLRFSAALLPLRRSLSHGVMIFNRLEPAFVFRSAKNSKIGFVHSDIQELLSPSSEYLWRHSLRLYFTMEQKVISSLDHLYVVNSRAVEFYNNRYPAMRQKISFLPTWVDEGVFSPPTASAETLRSDMSSRFGIPADGRWILFVGRFQKAKNPLLLVRTFRALLSQLQGQARLLLVGEGNLKRDIVALVKELGVEDRVFFLGFQPQQELCTLYQASDALVLTSEFEGMPRAALEALGCGLPVVSTPSGDIRRVLVSGKNGELVLSRDPEALAAALVRVLAKPRESLVADCLAAVEHFRPRSVLAEVYRLCERLSPGA